MRIGRIIKTAITADGTRETTIETMIVEVATIDETETGAIGAVSETEAVSVEIITVISDDMTAVDINANQPITFHC